jgi:hypothetical protein
VTRSDGMPLESLYSMLLALDLFSLDLLAAVATHHSLADAPFAQIAWIVIVIFGVAAMVAFVGGLSYVALQTPMPAPGGYRDTPETPQKKQSKRTSVDLLKMVSADARRMLWHIGIGCGIITAFLIPFTPIWLANVIFVSGASAHTWLNIAALPNRNASMRYYSLARSFIGIDYGITSLILAGVVVVANVPLGSFAHLAIPAQFFSVRLIAWMLVWWVGSVTFLRLIPQLIEDSTKEQSVWSFPLFMSSTTAPMVFINLTSTVEPTIFLTIFYWVSFSILLAWPIFHGILAIRAIRTASQLEVVA